MEEILEADAQTTAEIIETAEDPAAMAEAVGVTGDRRKALVDAISGFTGQRAVYQNAPSFAYVIGDYTVDKNGTVSGPANERLMAVLQTKGFMAD